MKSKVIQQPDGIKVHLSNKALVALTAAGVFGAAAFGMHEVQMQVGRMARNDRIDTLETAVEVQDMAMRRQGAEAQAMIETQQEQCKADMNGAKAAFNKMNTELKSREAIIEVLIDIIRDKINTPAPAPQEQGTPAIPPGQPDTARRLSYKTPNNR